MEKMKIKNFGSSKLKCNGLPCRKILKVHSINHKNLTVPWQTYKMCNNTQILRQSTQKFSFSWFIYTNKAWSWKARHVQSTILKKIYTNNRCFTKKIASCCCPDDNISNMEGVHVKRISHTGLMVQYKKKGKTLESDYLICACSQLNYTDLTTVTLYHGHDRISFL
jgi:hypothetical protein